MDDTEREELARQWSQLTGTKFVAKPMAAPDSGGDLQSWAEGQMQRLPADPLGDAMQTRKTALGKARLRLGQTRVRSLTIPDLLFWAQQ